MIDLLYFDGAMSLDGAVGRREEPAAGKGSGNGVTPVANVAAPPAPVVGRPTYGDRRLRLNPNTEHKPEKYDDLQTEFDPAIYSSLERHLPPSMLEVARDAKLQFMSEILARYLPETERTRVQRQKDYRQKIMSAYQPLHKDLYNIHPSAFFIPSFIKAINDNTEDSFRSIMSEPSPGVYTFAMLQPSFCDMLLDEVENFEKWVNAVKFKIMRPNTMNKYGAVLDDFGLEAMLNKLMEEFICPISRVFFPEVGGSTLDSHHGFVVEYGKDKDVELGFHVDDSEVTLNVCLGKQFSGGELFFRGVRCDKHVNSETQSEEILDYAHVPGQAVLHRGRHRHGARATTSGHRINLLLWCRSSVFRETKKYQKDFSSWCGECQREKKERQRQSVAATKLAFLRSAGGSII
ncbi:2-oxoglutarate and iron-dependent oxygenase domain-containing protein CP2-like isoform X2 [Typha angustifolia]|uniref:2-oxoglutarate and iron-dependent oxygenase domain-containing protein CP2-like isoform X2 n=2 Tax=Typha TaxID=4732 RepID=UPI003C2D93C3